MERLTLTVSEAAQVIGVCRAKAYELAHSEGFPTLRCGRKLLVSKQGLEKWIETHSGSEDNACS